MRALNETEAKLMLMIFGMHKKLCYGEYLAHKLNKNYPDTCRMLRHLDLDGFVTHVKSGRRKYYAVSSFECLIPAWEMTGMSHEVAVLRADNMKKQLQGGGETNGEIQTDQAQEDQHRDQRQL